MSDNFEVELVVHPDGSIAIVAVTYESRDMGSEAVGEPIYEFANARALADEIERLRAERPSCETCGWAEPVDKEIFCEIGDCYVDPDKTDGVCLWRAK